MRDLALWLESELPSLEGEMERGQPEGFWPTVYRVLAVGARGLHPVFRVVGGRLGPAAARAAARQAPGVFIRGAAQQVRTFANQLGGQVVGPERHGAGRSHYHLIRPNGDRIHLWYGPDVPHTDFFE
jgi:hypothetical protein